MARAARCQAPAASAPRPTGRKPKTLYQAKARVRASARHRVRQQRLLQRRERARLLAVRAERAQHGRHHDQRRGPAPAASTRRPRP